MRSPDAQPPSGLARPQSLRDLFWSFTKLALQGFGGVVAVVQLVDAEAHEASTAPPKRSVGVAAGAALTPSV